MKLNTTLMMMSVFAMALSMSLGARAETSGSAEKQQQAPASAPQADQNLEKDKDKDTTATEAQAIVALQCVTGDCYKDAVTDPCYSIGENGCIRPTGNASDSGSSPAKANK